jgi:hypothetical protein
MWYSQETTAQETYRYDQGASGYQRERRDEQKMKQQNKVARRTGILI